MLKILDKVSSSFGMQINAAKTEVVILPADFDADLPTFALTGGEVKTVSAFKYLGSWITQSGGVEKEIGVRVGRALGVFASFDKIWASKKMQNPVDRVKYVLSGHHGPLTGLRRNPFNSKFFLSIGDWTARVWTDDTAVRTPILTTRYHNTYLTGGTWSPTRPGVFFTTKMDGTMDVWDLYYKHNEPTLTVQVSDSPLTAFAAHDSGSMVAVGTADGSINILQMSSGLSEMALNEKSAINNMFDRETAREKNLEKAIKEAKVKARKEAARKDELADNVTPEQLQAIEDEFMAETAEGATGYADEAGHGDGGDEQGGA
ncbi:hypothetical protein FOA52_009675 [Chlamydomonas sp. UWO 241]|nr:hypothetical protein FOA52_009675 [Chlamydomonas sp. UWO 241]